MYYLIASVIILLNGIMILFLFDFGRGFSLGELFLVTAALLYWASVMTRQGRDKQ